MSDTSNPQPPANSVGPQSNTTEERNTAHEKMNVIPQIPPPEQHKTDTTHCKPDQMPLWKIILEVGAVAVGIVVAYIYYGQLEVMRGQLTEIIKQYPEIKKSADAAVVASEAATESLNTINKQFQLDQRPYLIVTCCGNVESVIGAKEPTAGKPVAANMEIHNIGKTPALNVIDYKHMVFGKQVKYIRAEPPNPARQGSTIPQGPVGLVYEIGVGKGDIFSFDASTAKLSDFMVWDGERPIIVFGRVVYDDRFGNHYCTPINYIWLHDSVWGIGEKTILLIGKEHRPFPDMCPSQIPY